MKSYLGLATMFASLAVTNSNNSPRIKDEYLDKEEIEKRKKAKEEKEKLMNISKGLKIYHYEEGVLWARNQKNADRKANNKNWTIIF